MQRKLRFNSLFILSICLLTGLHFEGPAFAQSDTQPAAQVEQAQEIHDNKELENMLKRYQTDQEKVIDDTSKIHNTDATTTEVSDSEINEMRPDDTLHKASEAYLKKKLAEEKKKTLPGQSLSENIRIPLATLQKLSEEELLKLLKENTKESQFGPYLDKFPKLTLFSIKLIKDKEAIPSAVKIAEDKDKLIWFGGVMISTFLLGFLLERMMRKEGRSVLGSIGLYFLRVLILTGVRFAIIGYFYGKELTPAMKVFNETFL